LNNSKVSSLLSELKKVCSASSEFERFLESKNIFRFKEMKQFKGVRIGFALYVLPTKKQFRDIVNEMKKENKELYKSKSDEIDKLDYFASDYPSFSTSTRFEASNNRSFSQDALSEFPIFIKKFLAIIEKIQKEKGFTKECAYFVFKKGQASLAGGLKLPMELHLPAELAENTGEASIDGLELSFSKSPVGLQQVSFSLKPEKLQVKVIAINHLLISTDTLREVFEHSNRLVKLFLSTAKKVDK
jgi:hypothetical protein